MGYSGRIVHQGDNSLRHFGLSSLGIASVILDNTKLICRANYACTLKLQGLTIIFAHGYHFNQLR